MEAVTVGSAACPYINIRRVSSMNEAILRGDADKRIVQNLFPSKFRVAGRLIALQWLSFIRRRMSVLADCQGYETSTSYMVLIILLVRTFMFADLRGFTSVSLLPSDHQSCALYSSANIAVVS
jgi:hypothetical protein